MAFSNIEKEESLNIIDIAIVDSGFYQDNDIYKKTFEYLSDKNNKDRLFNTVVTNLDNAKKLLIDNKITGYLLFGSDDVRIVVFKNGINETILKYVVDEIESQKEVSSNLIKKEIMDNNGEVNYSDLINKINGLFNDDQVKLNNISNKNLSYTMVEFYTLIAMAALYGSIIAMTATNKAIANVSNVGMRSSVAPIKKSMILLGGFLASYIVQVIGLSLLFIYTIFVLKVDYGNDFLAVVLLSLAGSLAGLSLGVTVSTLIKSSEGTKTGIIIAITMFWCYLSGMMGISTKYLFDKNLPFLNKVNPAGMITDGFYSLYYYGVGSRFEKNIISLIIFSLLLFLISLISLRRQKYDSI
ncbi:MAG: ABC transporter permease [Tenericutes bacterium]|nr:ABC transporter permease [Mycoplasmatota bacterium]